MLSRYDCNSPGIEFRCAALGSPHVGGVDDRVVELDDEPGVDSRHRLYSAFTLPMVFFSAGTFTASLAYLRRPFVASR